ncbi:hypothetical protein M9Y10_009828 [Tritrichomonas musculus]|uniref:Uncharacterized protein n=1 Tax=Tritrichomonas musculus TaxID=1915356 RepID=A0ABR2IPK5_9EUKA
MDQKRNVKENNCSYQSSSQIQPQPPESGSHRISNDLNSTPTLIEEEANKTFQKSKKIISEIKFNTNQESLNPISLEEFIVITNLFLNSAFTNVLDKKILFAAFGIIHQYFLSLSYVPTLEHMLPFTTLWKTFQKAFDLLNFDQFTSKIDETLEKIKFIINNGKQVQNDNKDSVDDYDDIVDTFSILFQCFETLKLGENDLSQIIEKCFLAIEKTYNYVNGVHSLSSQSIYQIQLQLSIVQRILKSQQKTYNLRSYIKRITNMMLSIPSTFDKIRFNPNSNFYNDSTFLCKILKTIIDFFSTFANLMVNVSDWKEIQSLFANIQEIYSMIEQPSLSTNNNSMLLRNICEKLRAYANDKTFKDTHVLKELNSIIDILPPELYQIRISFSNFLTKRKEVSPEFFDSQRLFILYQSFLDFASKLCISNGPIYDLSYKLLQIYSKSLINSIICEYVDIVPGIMSRIINVSKSGNSKVIEVLRMTKLTQDLFLCDIVSPHFKSFLNRFQLLLFYLRYILIPINAKSALNPFQNFPNFQTFKILTTWLNADLGNIFQKKSEIVQNYLLQFENQNGSDVQSSIDSAFSSFGLYGNVINETDVSIIKQFKKFYKFKRCVEDFSLLNTTRKCVFGDELLFEQTEFSKLLESILQKTQIALSEKVIIDLGVIRPCFDMSTCLMYKEGANPNHVVESYGQFLRSFTIPLFKHKLHYIFRYTELFVLLKNEGETEDDDHDITSQFSQAFISYCSFLDDDSLQKVLSLYPTMKNLIPEFSFYGFDTMFDIFKKLDSLFNEINQINSTFFLPLNFENKFKTCDIVIFVNLIESFQLTINKLIFYKALSNESNEIIQKIIMLIKEVSPISLYLLVSSASHVRFERKKNDDTDDPSQLEDKKSLDLKEFIKNISQLLTNLYNSVEFTDFQKSIRNELSIITSMFSFYLNWCPDLRFLSNYFREFIQLSQIITTDFSPVLFRMLKITNAIYNSLKKFEVYTLEITSLHQITQKVRIIILNALNTIFLKKDLKIVINCIHSFATKYKIIDDKPSFMKYSIDDFFNYQKINSSLLEQLYEDVQNLYFFDVRTSNSTDNLAFQEVYDILTPALSIINNLFDESTPNLVKNFFSDGCIQVKLLTKRLESSLSNLDNKINEEKLILQSYQNYNDDDDKSESNETRNEIRQVDQPTDYQNSGLRNSSFDSIVKMYQGIIDKKEKQNELTRKSINDMKSKLSDHREISQELVNFTNNQIPVDFENYSRQILEPLKNFQDFSGNKSKHQENSSKNAPNSDDDSQFDIFSGSEFNANFAYSILMKIEELEQQNGALSRYIDVQRFFSVVDDYVKNHKDQSTVGGSQEIQKPEQEINDDSNANSNDNANANNNDNNNITSDNIDVDNKNDDNDGYEYEYEYEYVDDEERTNEIKQFEQDEIKLIMMINSMRNSGKNKSTLREFVPKSFREGISQIELEFYKLINKACQLFKENENNNNNDDTYTQSSTKSKIQSEKKSLLKIAKSMVQDVSDDNDL